MLIATRIITPAILCLCLVVGSPARGSDEAPTSRPFEGKEPVPIEPWEEMQQYLGRIAWATRQNLKTEIALAMDLTHGDWILPQVLYYLAYGPEDEDRRRSAADVVTVGIALHDFSPTSVMYCAGPYLSSDDPKLQQAAGVMLYKGGVFEPEYGYDKTPSFTAIRGYLSNDGQGAEALPDDPPPYIVKAMYGRNPSAALETMRELYGSLRGKPLTEEEWALIEHAKTHSLWLRSRTRDTGGPEEDAEKADLDKLSQSKFWWVRLYVAYLLRFHAELWDEQLVERLAKDEHELVRECIEKLKADPTAAKVRELNAEIRANKQRAQ